MSITRNLSGIFSRPILGRALLPAPKVVPVPRILITADLGELWHEEPLQAFLRRMARLKLPVTLFASNEFLDGRKGYPVVKRIRAAARRSGQTLEIASHALRHVSLSGERPARAAALIKASILEFRRAGIPVRGFRAPYLSIERSYPRVLKALSAEPGILAYDSSSLYERNMAMSRVHDVLNWKPPHRVGTVWELPLSCLDDYHLFDKLGREDSSAAAYWVRKCASGLRRFNYFHMLVHPEIISAHFPALEAFLGTCLKAWGRAPFATCGGLTDELNARNKEKAVR